MLSPSLLLLYIEEITEINHSGLLLGKERAREKPRAGEESILALSFLDVPCSRDAESSMHAPCREPWAPWVLDAEHGLVGPPGFGKREG